MIPITMNLPFVLHRKTKHGSENSSQSSEKSSSSEADEARNLVKSCAEPRPVGDSIKAAIYRAADRLGFTYSRTKDLWYGDAYRIDAREMDALRAAAAAAEIDLGITGLKVLRARLSEISSTTARQAVDGIDTVLGVLGDRDQQDEVV